jgi:DNA-binding MarR family transcriptional regulator
VELIASIIRAEQIALSTVAEALEQFNLSFARYEALLLLSFATTGGMPVGKMADRLMVRPPSVTNVVGKLETQGLVERAKSRQDGRVTIVSITPTGRAVVERASIALAEVAFGLADLDEGEIASLLGILRRFRLT